MSYVPVVHKVHLRMMVTFLPRHSVGRVAYVGGLLSAREWPNRSEPALRGQLEINKLRLRESVLLSV